MDQADKKPEGHEGKKEKEKEKEKEDPTPSPEIRVMSPPPPSEQPPPKKRKRNTVVQARIPALLAFAMCWPRNVEIRKGGPEPKTCDAGLYVVKRGAGGRHGHKTYIIPALEKSPQKAECSSPPPPAPVTVYNEQPLHQHLQTEQKQQEVKQEEMIEVKVEKGKSDRIRELELELKILRETLGRNELYTIPESGTPQCIEQPSPYRISVPGRYCGEILYEEHDEFDYVIRSPRVRFTD